jgi:hypothetical protein
MKMTATTCGAGNGREQISLMTMTAGSSRGRWVNEGYGDGFADDSGELQAVNPACDNPTLHKRLWRLRD